jgi:nanoRNase/pAp phosphatase (c-di-AMP/oligoRNAs hydrolase)
MGDNLERLHQLVQNKRKVLIATHTNPDPDSIASAYALRHLFTSWGINSVLVYGGIIGRAENKAMITRLQIPLRSIHTINPFNFTVVSLVDCQPFSGNAPLPVSLVPSIVVDHHPARKISLLKKVPFVDIRPDYGSTSSILAEYLVKQGVDINRRLATALYYGIMSDTRYLGRDAHEVDVKLSAALYTPRSWARPSRRSNTLPSPVSTFASLDRPSRGQGGILPRGSYSVSWARWRIRIWWPSSPIF